MSDYVTSRGITVQFCGIATLIDKLGASFKAPDEPFYEVDLPGTLDPATGKPRTEKHLLDATSADTPEEKARLAEYEKAKATQGSKYSAALQKLLFLRGVVFPEPSAEWIAQQEYVGIVVPADPMERRVHYVQTEVIGNLNDIEQIMIGVMEASSVPTQALVGMQATFRDTVGKLPGAKAGGSTDTAGERLVLQPPIPGSPVGGKNGHPRKPVRQSLRRG